MKAKAGTWGGPRKRAGRPPKARPETGKSLPYRIPIDRYPATVERVLQHSHATGLRPGEVIANAIAHLPSL